MKYTVDVAVIRDGKLNIQGWAFGENPETPVGFMLKDRKGRKLPFNLHFKRRDAVIDAYLKDYVKEHGDIKRNLGYSIETPYKSGDMVNLYIHVDGKTRKRKFDDKRIKKFNSPMRKKREKYLSLLNPEYLERTYEFLKKNGLKASIRKAGHKIKGISEEEDYNDWRRALLLGEEALSIERNVDFPIKPLFSIVIPAYNTEEKYLRRLLDSIKNQTYGKFELCIADASDYSDPKVNVKDIVNQYSKTDKRFRIKVLNENKGIAENTNEAIRMAKGDYIVLSDHDDELDPSALYECAKAINENEDIEIIYTDEDKIDFDSSFYFEPHFKPDFNIDLLRSVNYICHMFVAKRTLLEKIAKTNEKGEKIYERSEFDGAQDYDLILRACEEAIRIEDEKGLKEKNKDLIKKGLYTSGNIIHIKRALYHWRSHPMSTAANPEAKLYAFKAGEKAIFSHCERMGIPVECVKSGVTPGFYHVKYKNNSPLISVIIPNKDHIDDLDKAISSLMEGNYKNLEFIICENNSEDPKTFKYYKELMFKHKNVKVVYWEREFNYSAINNFAAKSANGEYLLFLNNDIEMINKDSISELLGLCQRDDVGAVGARLLYPDDTIQHAGVVLGFGGIAGATFVGIDERENTYMHRAMCIQDLSAVTAACLLSKKSVFEAVSGFNEDLAVAFNDIDYCMKVRALGKLVVYNPYATFHHYESKSRGYEDNPEKIKRFNGEIIKFARIWKDILKEGDPYYHPALSLKAADFRLRDLDSEGYAKAFDLPILRDIIG